MLAILKYNYYHPINNIKFIIKKQTENYYSFVIVVIAALLLLLLLLGLGLGLLTLTLIKCMVKKTENFFYFIYGEYIYGVYHFR